MAIVRMQRSGLILALVGWLGILLACGLPMWKITSFTGANAGMSQGYSEGLWETCTYEGLGQSQCRRYTSLTEVSSDLQASRALVVTSLFTAFFAFLSALSGRDYINCVDGTPTSRFDIVAGVIFIASSIMVLVPVSWCASNVFTNVYNPMVPAVLRRELGSALYIGWIASALQLFGGAILCFSGPSCTQDAYSKKCREDKACSPTGYPMKDYV
ncbi:PREDICTED: claudin-4-like [Merops nubicus]|uniref:claudin-4-like n=1 Tax=Merops nubicus TaxID=57421 RepID=UPI0004F055F8|nr:PREDICTED: claudin-4-like [Merops nubicus]